MEHLLRALEQRAYEVRINSGPYIIAASPDDEFNQVTLERSSASWVLGLADAPIMICDDRPTPSANIKAAADPVAIGSKSSVEEEGHPEREGSEIGRWLRQAWSADVGAATCAR